MTLISIRKGETMERWPGTENFGNENVPWNVLSWETYHKTLSDRGSLPTALSAGMLTNLGNENNTTLMSVLDENATSVYSNRRYATMECDMEGILGIYGATVFLGSTYKFGYKNGVNRWHKVRRVNGLYKNNSGGDHENVQLTPYPTLVDDDLSSAPITNVNDQGINIGLQVGSSEFGIVYGNTVDCICVAASITLSNFSIYKSDDNRTWTSVEKSTYTEGAWNAGEQTVASVRGSGVNGKLILFSEPQTANYFKVVTMSTQGPFDLYEIFALNLQGELRYSDDLTNWNGAARDIGFLDFLLFKFDSLRNEIRAVDYTVDPFDPGSTMAARIDLDHIEIYADTAPVDFGATGETRIITITDGSLGTIGQAQAVTVMNNDAYGRNAKYGYAHIAISPRTVSSLSMTSGGTTFQLSDSTNRVNYCRYLLNSTYDDIGTLADTSVVMGGTMAAWTEVAAAPVGNQFVVNYNTGLVTTGNVIPAGATVSFAYASPGAASIQISADGSSSWKSCGYGNRITLTQSPIGPTETALFYARSNLTYFTETVEDVIRTALCIVEMSFQGAKS
jgi:hypothetical protein